LGAEDLAETVDALVRNFDRAQVGPTRVTAEVYRCVEPGERVEHSCLSRPRETDDSNLHGDVAPRGGDLRSGDAMHARTDRDRAAKSAPDERVRPRRFNIPTGSDCSGKSPSPRSPR